MDYLKIYNNLMETRKKRIPEKDLYYEKHHIIMRSMGGTNDLDNLVLLTAREHFLAHWLLWRIYNNKQTAFAFSMMCNPGKSGHRKITSSIGYSEMREACQKFNKGKKMSTESRIKMSLSHKGKKLSEKTKKNMSDSRIGRKLSDATKLKLSIASKNMSNEQKEQIRNTLKGKSRSEETIKKMSESLKGRTPWNKGKKFNKIEI